VAESSRLEDLRRRVQSDPSSIAFAQLAEEYRRAAMFQESVDVCRAGLAVHPSYLSARVTLGRSLVELEQYADARHELEQVLQTAPENLAAIRGLADAFHRQGALADALTYYRAALAIARHDPDLEQTVAELAHQVEPAPAVQVDDDLSFEQATEELMLQAPSPVAAASDADDWEQTRAVATIAALQQLLNAVHVVRAERCA